MNIIQRKIHFKIPRRSYIKSRKKKVYKGIWAQEKHPENYLEICENKNLFFDADDDEFRFTYL